MILLTNCRFVTICLVLFHLITCFDPEAPKVELTEDPAKGLSVKVTEPLPAEGLKYHWEVFDKDGGSLGKNDSSTGEWLLTDCNFFTLDVWYTKPGADPSEKAHKELKDTILGKAPPAPDQTQAKETPDSIEVTLGNDVWFDQLTNNYLQYIGDKPDPAGKQQFKDGKVAITECKWTKLEVFATTKCGLDSAPFTIDLTKVLTIPKPPIDVTKDVQTDCILAQWKPPIEEPELITNYKYEVVGQDGTVLKSDLVNSSITKLALNNCHGVKLNLYSTTRCKLSEQSASLTMDEQDYPTPLKPSVAGEMVENKLKANWSVGDQSMPIAKFIIDIKSKDATVKPIHDETKALHGEYNIPAPLELSVKALGECGKTSEVETIHVNRSTPEAPKVDFTQDPAKGLSVKVTEPLPAEGLKYHWEVFDKDGGSLGKNDSSTGEWLLTDCNFFTLDVWYTKPGADPSEKAHKELKDTILGKAPPAPDQTQAKETPDSIEVTLGNGVWFDQLTNNYLQYIGDKPDPAGKQQFKDGKAAITECKWTKLEVFATTKCGLDSAPFTIDLTKLLTVPKPPIDPTKDVQSDCILAQWKPPTEKPELIANYKYEVVGQDGTVLKSGQVNSSITKLALNDCHGVKLNLYSVTRCKTSKDSALLTMEEQDYPAPLKPIVAGEMMDNKLKANWTVGDQSMPVGKFIIDIKPKDASAQPIHAETTDGQGEYNVLAPLELSVKAVGQCGKESEVETIQVNRSVNYSFSLTLITSIAMLLSLASMV